jgi:hypothetical protein
VHVPSKTTYWQPQLEIQKRTSGNTAMTEVVFDIAMTEVVFNFLKHLGHN